MTWTSMVFIEDIDDRHKEETKSKENESTFWGILCV